MKHRFFLKLWPEMRLGATVMVWKQNKHRASGKLLILQKQRRPNRFNQMLRPCWLFFYANGIVHKEFVPPGQTVNQQFYLKVLKRLRDSVWKKWPECGAVLIGSFTTTMPLPTWPGVCSSFWQKTTWRLSHILPIHPTLHHATFSCSLVWKARWKGNVLLMSVKWKIKRRSWTTSAQKSSRNVFSSRKNIGTSVSSQKESTLKETRFVIV